MKSNILAAMVFAVLVGSGLQTADAGPLRDRRLLRQAYQSYNYNYGYNYGGYGTNGGYTLPRQDTGMIWDQWYRGTMNRNGWYFSPGIIGGPVYPTGYSSGPNRV